jgi:hypothetical protein
VFVWVLFMSLSGCVFLPLQSASAARVRVSENENDLRMHMIVPKSLPGFHAVSDHAVPLDEVLPGSGSYFNTIRNGGLQASWVRTFVSFDDQMQVGIRLTAATSNRAARAMSRKGVPAPALGRDWVTEESFDGATGHIYIASPQGSVCVELFAQLFSGRPQDMRQLRHAAVSAGVAQHGALPVYGNLSDLDHISLQNLHTQLFVSFLATLGTLLIYSIAYAIVRDRGSRDQVIAMLTRRHVYSSDPNDVSLGAKERLQTYRRRAVIRIAALVALLLVTYPMTLAGQTLMLVGVGLLAATWDIFRGRRDNTQSFRAPHSIGTLVFAGLGSLLSLILLSAGLYVLVCYLVGKTAQPNDVAAAEYQALLRGFLIVALVLFGLADIPYSLARRLWSKRTKELLDRDHRPEVLFLRSFEDGKIRIRTHRTSRQNLLERLSLRRRDRFEELIAWSAWKYGPVVGLGEYGYRLPPLGAAREHYADEHWQQAVQSRIDTSRLIIVFAGRTSSLEWEYEELVRRQALGRTIVLFPPVSTPEQLIREQAVALHLPIDPARFTATRHAGRHPLAVIFGGSTRGQVISAKSRSDIDFEEALERAVELAEQWQAQAAPAAQAIGRETTPLPPQLARPRREKRWLPKTRTVNIVIWSTVAVLTLLDKTLYAGAPDQTSQSPTDMRGATPIAHVVAYSLGNAPGARWIAASSDSRLIVATSDGRQLTYATHSPVSRIVADQDSIYVVTPRDKEITALYRTGNTLGKRWSIQLPAAIGDIAVSHDLLLTSEPDTGTLRAFHTQDGTNALNVKLGGEPTWLAVGSTLVYAADISHNQIVILDRARLHTVVKRIPLQINPSGIAVTGRRLLVSSVLGARYEGFDVATNKRVYSIATTNITRQLTASTRTAAVTIQGPSPAVVEFDPATGSYINRRNLPTLPNGLLADGAKYICSFAELKLLVEFS